MTVNDLHGNTCDVNETDDPPRQEYDYAFVQVCFGCFEPQNIEWCDTRSWICPNCGHEN